MEKVRFNDFMVHFETLSFLNIEIQFHVYPVCDYVSKEGSGTAYILKDSDYELLKDYDKELAEELFEGSFLWRGIWEGRLYFKKDEYWGEELKTMFDLYEKSIVPWCKEKIKNEQPNYHYED